jgi:hypothetical protein
MRRKMGNMLFTTIIFMLMCFFIAYKALKRYFKEPQNYENIFAWGIGFLLYGFIFMFRLINIAHPLPTICSVLVHFWTLAVIWLQVFAIAISAYCRHACIVGGVPCPSCGRKKVRVFMSVVLVILMTVFIALSFVGSNVGYVNTFDLYFTGNVNLEIFVHSAYMLLSVCVILILLPARNFRSLVFAYLMSFLYSLVHIAYILRTDLIMSDTLFPILSYGLETAYVLIVFAVVYRLTGEE